MNALKSCLPSSSPAACRMAPTSSATSDSRPGLPRLRSHHLSYTHQRYLDCNGVRTAGSVREKGKGGRGCGGLRGLAERDGAGEGSAAVGWCRAVSFSTFRGTREARGTCRGWACMVVYGTLHDGYGRKRTSAAHFLLVVHMHEVDTNLNPWPPAIDSIHRKRVCTSIRRGWRPQRLVCLAHNT